jgi:hypothetical protein
MGQKVSPLSLRENLRYVIWGSNHNFVTDQLLREYILNYFYKKGILINDLSIKKDGTTLYLELDFLLSRSSTIYTRKFRRFFKKKTNIFKKFKKKNYKKYKKIFFINKSIKIKNIVLNSELNLKSLNEKTKQQKSIKNFLSLLCKLYKVNKVCFKAKRLETNLNFDLLNQIKKESNKIGLFRQIKHKQIQDLIILSSILLDTGKIKALTINSVLAKHFAWLPKKHHKHFFVFLRDFFKILYAIDKNKKNQLNGIKLLVSGRISGKTQASNFRSIVGRIFAQTVNVDVDYSIKTSYSKLGTFGWKIWIAKNNIIK